jgi:hypothetical protein
VGSGQVLAAHAYNPSYLGGKKQDPISKILNNEKGWCSSSSGRVKSACLESVRSCVQTPVWKKKKKEK